MVSFSECQGLFESWTQLPWKRRPLLLQFDPPTAILPKNKNRRNSLELTAGTPSNNTVKSPTSRGGAKSPVSERWGGAVSNEDHSAGDVNDQEMPMSGENIRAEVVRAYGRRSPAGKRPKSVYDPFSNAMASIGEQKVAAILRRKTVTNIISL